MANTRRVRDLPESSKNPRSGSPYTPARNGVSSNRGAPTETGPRGAGPTSTPSASTDPHTRAVGGARGFSTVLRNRYFLRLWMAQLISQTIMNAANYGLIIVVATRSNTSYFATSIAIVAFALPAVVFGAPAGVLIDRFDRRTVLWVSNILRAVACIIFAVSLFFDKQAILPAYAISFIIATIGQFFAPAEGAAIPLLVHREELINALSLFNITFTIAQALGLILLGPAIILFTPPIVLGTAHHNITVQPYDTLFVVVALLYIVCTFLILSIPVRKLRLRDSAMGQQGHRTLVAESQRLRGIWDSILECGRFIERDRLLLISVLQLCLGGTVVAIIAMIAPGFVETFFQRPVGQAALVFVPAGLGLVLGSALTPRIVRRFRYNATITVGVVFLSVCAIGLTAAHALAVHVDPQGWSGAALYLFVAIILTFLVGVSLDFIQVPAQTLMQERSPDWIKGRVLAVQGMVLNLATVIFVPLLGIIADHFQISVAVDAMAVAVAITGTLSVYAAARVGKAQAKNPAAPSA